jgi:hypothetical protein
MTETVEGHQLYLTELLRRTRACCQAMIDVGFLASQVEPESLIAGAATFVDRELDEAGRGQAMKELRQLLEEVRDQLQPDRRDTSHFVAWQMLYFEPGRFVDNPARSMISTFLGWWLKEDGAVAAMAMEARAIDLEIARRFDTGSP